MTVPLLAPLLIALQSVPADADCPAHEVVVIVANPGLVVGGRTGRLNASNQPRLGERRRPEQVLFPCPCLLLPCLPFDPPLGSDVPFQTLAQFQCVPCAPLVA